MKTPRNTIALVATARGMANAFLRRELRRAGLSGLSPSHGNIVHALMEYGEMPMGGLAENIRRDKSTVTTLVAKLERLGYVKRRASAADSRLSVVALTRKGRGLRQVFQDISEKMFAVALDGVDDAEADALGAALGKIIANFSRHGGV